MKYKATFYSFSLYWILFLSFLLFFRLPTYPFLSIDDGIHVSENPLVQNPTLHHAKELWKGPFQGLFIPMTYHFWQGISYIEKKFDNQAISPSLFHIANVLLHSFNSWLLFILLYSMFGRGAYWGTLLYLFHPLQMEAVAWVSGTKDLLATFFILIAMHLNEQYRLNRKNIILVEIFIFWFFALLSKPSMVVFGVFLVFWDVIFHQDKIRNKIPFLISSLILPLPIIWITRMGQPHWIIDEVVSIFLRPLVFLDNLIFYFSKVIFPIFLSFDYGRLATQVLSMNRILFSVLGVLLVFYLIFKSIYRSLLAGLFVLFVIWLLPTSGFLPFYFQKYSSVADRFLYTAFIVIATAVSFFYGQLNIKFKLLLIAFILFLPVLSFFQSHYWSSDVSLYAQMVKVNPSATNCYNYAKFLEDEEEKDPSQNLLIDTYYSKAIEKDPKYYKAFHNLGLRASKRGEQGKAISYYQKAIEVSPLRAIESYNNLGVILGEKGDLKESMVLFQEALKINPYFKDARANLEVAERLQK